MAIGDYLLGEAGGAEYSVPMTVGDRAVSAGKAFGNRLGDALADPNIQRMLAETGAGLSQGQGIGQALGGASTNYARRLATQKAQSARDVQHAERMNAFLQAIQGQYGSSLVGPKSDASTLDSIAIDNDKIVFTAPNTGSLQKAQGAQVAGEQTPLEGQRPMSWRNPLGANIEESAGVSGVTQQGGPGIPMLSTEAVSYAGMDPEDVQALARLRQASEQDETGMLGSILGKIDRDLALKAAREERIADRRHDLTKLNLQQTMGLEKLAAQHGYDLDRMLADQAFRREIAKMQIAAGREENALDRGARKEEWVATDERIRDLAADKAELEREIAVIRAGDGSADALKQKEFELKDVKQRAEMAVTLNNPDVDWNSRKRLAMTENARPGQTSFWVPIDGAGWFGKDSVQSVRLPVVDGEQVTSDMLMGFLQANPNFSPEQAIDYWYLEAGQTAPFGTLKAKGE